MKITVKRSWFPWGMPNIIADSTNDMDCITVEGAYHKLFIFEMTDFLNNIK